MPTPKKTAKRTVRGPGVMGSMKAVKDSMKTKGLGGGKLKIIGPESNFSVRFLTEPPDWFGFYEHYDANSKEFFPCWGGECCQDYERASFRYLANIFSQDDNKVMALKLPKGLAEDLIRSCEKYDTMMDRWYDISRVGSGMQDTKYNRDPDTPSKFRLPRGSELIDLGEMLQSMLDSTNDDADEADDDEEEEETPRRSSRPSSKSGGYRPSKNTRRVLDDDDDDYEDDDEDEDEEDVPRRPAKKRVTSSASKTGVAKKRTITRRK